MLIKSQLEVRLHTGRSVHFHPSRYARPSFLIIRGSGSETIDPLALFSFYGTHTLPPPIHHPHTCTHSINTPSSHHTLTHHTHRCSCDKGSTEGIHDAGGYGEAEGIPGQHHASLDRRDATLPHHPGLVGEHTIVYMYQSVTSALTSNK